MKPLHITAILLMLWGTASASASLSSVDQLVEPEHVIQADDISASKKESRERRIFGFRISKSGKPAEDKNTANGAADNHDVEKNDASGGWTRGEWVSQDENNADAGLPVTPPSDASGKQGSYALTDGNVPELNFAYSPEVYDSLVASWHERNVMGAYETFFEDFMALDSTELYTGDIPDSVYVERLKMILSPIHLGYNDVVKRYIVAYSRPKYSVMGRVLGLSHVYFPMIEEELAREGLPIELRMLPVIESALTPTAVSRVGATGLWQFMYATGKHYGLEVTSFVDERRDPVASTKAACRYLKDLYNMYDDWTLAIAAYNCGPGNVNKAIKRAGEQAKTFWDIYPYLPRETRGYVPSFIAATYAYTFHKQHGIEPIDANIPIATDTINICKLTHFEQITSTMGTSIETLRILNPQYKMDIIPAVEGKTYSLTIPQCDIARYINCEQEIMSKDSIYLAKYLDPNAKINLAAQAGTGPSTVHRVKAGDTLGGIAKKYGVKVSQLTQWNNIKSTSVLKIGQRIYINR